jgi:hypothetical protein
MAGKTSVKCNLCGAQVEKLEGVNYKDKWYHHHCHDLVLDKEELMTYICRVFGLKAPGPKVYSQRKNFIEKYGYTDRGMLNALKYHYEVQKGSTSKAQEGIGIIPHVYGEAQEFYKNMANKQEKFGEQLQKTLDNQQIITVYVKPKEAYKKKPKLYDLAELNKEE